MSTIVKKFALSRDRLLCDGNTKSGLTSDAECLNDSNNSSQIHKHSYLREYIRRFSPEVDDPKLNGQPHVHQTLAAEGSTQLSESRSTSMTIVTHSHIHQAAILQLRS